MCGGGFGGTPRAPRCTSRPDRTGSTTFGKCMSIRARSSGGPAERLTTGAGSDVAPTLSRDGTRLGFSTEQGSQRLWVFPLDPVARRLGSGKPVTEDHAIAGTSALSPDGQFVAYNLNRPGIDRDDAMGHEHHQWGERTRGDQRSLSMRLVAGRKDDCLQLH